MKVRLTILAFLALCWTAQAQNQIDKQGRKQGHWLITDNSGMKIFEANYKDGLESDTSLYYYANGQIRIRNVYTTPGRICRHEAFDEQGHLLATGIYNQKNRDGEWRLYTEAGKLIKIANYRMGIKEGLHVVFTSNGDTAEVATWKDNHRNGRWWKRLDGNGWITGTFVNGGLEGRVTEYDGKGQLVRDGNYLHGAKHGQYRYLEGGVVTIDETWDNGILRDRKILLHTTSPTYVSIYNIAYFYPKGSTKSVVMKMDGTTLSCNDNTENIFARIGTDLFVTIDKKNRVAANRTCIQGLGKDGEGRVIISLDPTPTFNIFPDEETQKMVQSLLRLDQLDE